MPKAAARKRKPVQPTARTTSISLGPHFEGFVRAQIATGRYGSASEVMREALRQMEERVAEHAAIVEALREGEESGGELPAEQVFAEVRERMKRRLK